MKFTRYHHLYSQIIILSILIQVFAGCTDANPPTADGATFSITSLPAAPSALNVRNAEQLTDGNTVAGKVVLSWKDNSTDEEGFYIERNEGRTNDWVLIQRTESNERQFTDCGLDYQVWYTYRVCVFNGIGMSSYSNEVSILPARFEFGPG